MYVLNSNDRKNNNKWNGTQKIMGRIRKGRDASARIRRSKCQLVSIHKMRRTYIRRSEHEMKCNAEVGFFTKPSNFYFKQYFMIA